MLNNKTARQKMAVMVLSRLGSHEGTEGEACPLYACVVFV